MDGNKYDKYLKSLSVLELDKLVAKVFFGYEFSKPSHGNCCTCQRCGRDHDSCSGNYSCYVSSDEGDDDFSAAWDILNNIVSKNWEITVCKWSFEEDRGPYRVHLTLRRDAEVPELPNRCGECNSFLSHDIEVYGSKIARTAVIAALWAKEIENYHGSV